MHRDKLGRFHGSRFCSNSWEERFWAKVDKNGPVPAHRPELGPCWVWTASVNTKGYGLFRFRGRPFGMEIAHVFIYRRMIGTLPGELQLDHLCRNRRCVNYEKHLEPVTAKENVRRGFGPAGLCARATHCLRGHEFTLDNTYTSPLGKRACRACMRVRNAIRYISISSSKVRSRRACKWASLFELYKRPVRN